jgi:acetolactate synthase-1/2/3 large subunit
MRPGALVEAITAGTPMLHLTGQIESDYLDRDLGFIHEAPGTAGHAAGGGQGAFRIRNPATALATLREAHRLAFTAPCGPVSIEIPIDMCRMLLDLPADIAPLPVALQPVRQQLRHALADRLCQAKRPLLWLGGGARGAPCGGNGFGQNGLGYRDLGAGPRHRARGPSGQLGSYNLQKPVEDFYQTCDAMLVVGSRLRSNET